MFVDNCPAHPMVQLSNVKLAFFPPNTTSHLQPCDAGIIRTLKAHYRRRLLRHILHHMGEVANASELAKKVNILDAILWARQGWEQVTPETVQKCFAQCGFGSGPGQIIDIPSPDENSDQLMDGTEWGEYVEHDKNTETSAPLSDAWKDDLLRKARGQDDDDNGEDEDNNNEELPPPAPPPSLSDCDNSLQTLMDYALSFNNSQLLDCVANGLDIISTIQRSRASKAQQSTMLQFFK